MQSQSPFQQAAGSTISKSLAVQEEQADAEEGEDPKKGHGNTLTWEQKQLLLLEQQQNELQLKLLQMQEELQKQALEKSFKAGSTLGKSIDLKDLNS